MVRSPTANVQANIPFWTMIAVAALYLPVALVAEALVDPGAASAAVDRFGPFTDVGGTPSATAVAAVVWLLTAGGFLAAFRAELDAMRTRTTWRPPDKGYLILAAGSLLAHPLTGLPFLFLVVAGYTLHRGLRVR